jgi:single-stranded DNA-binding protein
MGAPRTKRRFLGYPDDNQLYITGKMTCDPTVEQQKTSATSKLVPVAKFAIACNCVQMSPATVDFFECVAWASLGTRVAAQFHKGDTVLIFGKLRSGSLKRKAEDGRLKGEHFFYIVVKRMVLIGTPLRDVNDPEQEDHQPEEEDTP